MTDQAPIKIAEAWVRDGFVTSNSPIFKATLEGIIAKHGVQVFFAMMPPQATRAPDRQKIAVARKAEPRRKFLGIF